MLLPSNYIKAFCEIKGDDGKLKYTGVVISIDDASITVGNLAKFDTCLGTNVVLTVLEQTKGLQVFKAQVVSIEPTVVTLSDFTVVTMTERRMAFRALVNLPALLVLDSDITIGYNAMIMDLSIKGLSLWVDCNAIGHGLTLNDTVTIQFPLDTGHVVKVRCNVIRDIGRNAYSAKRYGCDFVSLTAEDAAAIQVYMTQLRTEYMKSQMKL